MCCRLVWRGGTGLRTSSIVTIVVAVLVVLGVIQVVRPVPHVVAARTISPNETIKGSAASLPWPKSAQADVGIDGVGQLAQQGPAGAHPIGSMAKMMTAYIVLKDHPLSEYQNGPSIPITANDVAVYQQDVATQQSVMPVVAGETLSERELLEGLLIPSGNNIATLLAQWDAGSVAKFTAEMNQTAKQLGLTQTHYNGPVGLSPQTVSSAADQLKLAEVMMKNPVFRQIVAMPQMVVPGTSHKVVYNYNYLIGHQNIIGVKTGSTIDAGGCVVLAQDVTIDGKPMTLYASVVGQSAIKTGTQLTSQIWASLDDGAALLKGMQSLIKPYPLLAQGQQVASIKVPWGSTVPVVAQDGVSLVGWPGMSYQVKVSLTMPSSTSIPSGTVVGHAIVVAGSHTVTVPVKTTRAITPPSLLYRLKR